MAKKPPYLAGKPLKGALAEPINIIKFGLIPGVHSQEEIDEYRSRINQEFFDRRQAKIPDLARHLGLDPDSDAYHGRDGRETLMEYTLIALATAVVPGFQEKTEGKWPRSEIFWLIQIVDGLKKVRGYTNDHDPITEYLIALRPELSKRTKKMELEAEIRQLQNRVSNLRSELKTAKIEAEKAFHKNAAHQIVKH